MKLKYTTQRFVQVSDWDALVTEIYGRPYSYQQQNGCKDRGIEYLTIPGTADDYQNTSVAEILNGREIGVSFEAWLARDPKQAVGNRTEEFAKTIWWERSFYPEVQTLANDMFHKGYVEAGEYIINIDW